MEDPAALRDWEFLHPSDAPPPLAAAIPSAANNDSDDGAIKHDYFSLHSHNLPPPLDPDTLSDDSSDNPSWVEPPSHCCYAVAGGGFWSGDSSPADSVTELGSDGDESGEQMDGSGIGELVEMGEERKSEAVVEGDERGKTAWWKMPIELLKICVLRMRPVWSLSAAAAFVGIVMLGRRLYKMKHKSRSIPLRIAMDDKKVSQFMVRAARLNEAFSVVRRVPIIRPALPAGGGAIPWSLVS